MTDKCRSCDQPVKWVKMSTGGRMLVNLPPEKRVVCAQASHVDEPAVYAVKDVYTSHFTTCPKASEHRRKR